MTNRRQFLKSTIALSPMMAAPSLYGASPSSRIALVIGNAAYLQVPLQNPTNDANAMADLLTAAGFAVDKRINATQQDMREAIDRFGESILSSDVKTAIFYFAGHGAQLDWNNYLLPVGARVDGPNALRQSCVNLGILLGKLSAASGKTFVIILDACRNNPFGSAYIPSQKGLSQFDAPFNSLLAYATSPGSVAADGTGRNGLYTEHLIRELSERNARLEDALKRVRLKVRLASDGMQIPWESTSLESDVFIFSETKKNLSDEEMEKQIEADLAEWARIKGSRNVDDWTGYLLKFPNGRFAEIAQARLNRLLAQSANPVSTVGAITAAKVPQANAVATPSGTKEASIPVSKDSVNSATVSPAVPSPDQRPLIEISEGRPVPQFIEPSHNPNSAGRFPLARKYTVGDRFVVRNYDIISRAGPTTVLTVTSVNEETDRVELNGGQHVWDTMGNIIDAPTYGLSDVPRQYCPAELQVGKKWTASWKNGRGIVVVLDFHVGSFETVRVPAGEFRAFITTFEGWDRGGRGSRHKGRLWIVPGLNIAIRHEHEQINARFGWSYCHELVSLEQHAVDLGYAPAAASSRAAVIRSL